jgi:hypothetical protein
VEEHAETTVRLGVNFEPRTWSRIRSKGITIVRGNNTTYPCGGRWKRWVMLAFILTTALVASGVISTELPWILCIMNAPLSIPFCDALMKSDIAVRPVQLQMRIGFNARPRVILSKTYVVYTNASLSKRLRKLSHSRASLLLRWQFQSDVKFCSDEANTYRYIGHPSANSLSLNLCRAKSSGPLLRMAPSGREPAGSECRSDDMARK